MRHQLGMTEDNNFVNDFDVQGVPTNKLHEQGYVSIGCEPCTKAVLPNQHEREGRWWWEVRSPYLLQPACCHCKHELLLALFC